MKFIDTARIHVAAGHGGVGCVSFRREKFVPKGGPDGGTGGRGGSVIIRANRHLMTLLDFQYRRNYQAPRGDHGLGANKSGRSGEDITLEVPAGTVIREAETGKIIADLLSDGDQTIAAAGGRGGRGNAEFATSTNQAPRNFEPGEEGEERDLELELKLLADVGLVGFPNAGKSTLISVVSAARPKIADYPFTTLVPNLGIVRVDDGASFVVADIPGILEGAHLGKGLGIQFLRHIERSKVLVFLVDSSRDDPRADYATLLEELKLFKKELVKKPRIAVLTKTDLLDAAGLKALAKIKFGTTPVFAISAVTGSGLGPLVKAMWSKVRPGPVKRKRRA
jgi:GTP-binding protein